MDGSYVLPTATFRKKSLQDRALNPKLNPSLDLSNSNESFSSGEGASSTLTFGSNTDNAVHKKIDKDEARRSHRSKILIATQNADVGELRKLSAEPGGFLDSELRRQTWPILLGGPLAEKSKMKDELPRIDGMGTISPAAMQKDELPLHKDENQVRLDVNRSFVSYPENLDAKAKDALRGRLEDLIVTTLRRHPNLQYFQGYHDIVSVLLLTLEDQQVAQVATERISLHRIRDSMGAGLEPVIGYLRLVQRILEKEDPELTSVVELAASLPYFGLSWVLTLMSHDLTSLAVISRLFDFLLAHNPAMVSYLGVALILLKKSELAALDEDLAEDPAVLHHTLSQLPNIIDTSDMATSLSSSPTKMPEEDLLSRADLTSSTSTPSPSVADSTLSTSAVSFSSDINEAAYDDLDDALDDSMLADPDVSGLAFSEHHDSLPKQQQQPQESDSPFKSSNGKKQKVSVPIDDLIATTLRLYETYPLVGEKGIGADDIMGPKSCVFTWSLSMEGLLDDKDADEIARKGIDIIIPLPLESADGLDQKDRDKRDLRRNRVRREQLRRRRVEVGIGAMLTIVGLAGVLLAVYGGEFKSSSQKGDWKAWARSAFV